MAQKLTPEEKMRRQRERNNDKYRVKKIRRN